MARLSERLRGYTGANPFRDSQARTYSEDKVAGEFHPTQLFWSLFNQQHEILLGTRGSGKTALLRMVSYSCLRRIHDERAVTIAREKEFIGFYIPMHLELARALLGLGGSAEEQRTRFIFAFNCAAVTALLRELEVLVQEGVKGATERLVAEARIVDSLMKVWTCLGTVDRPSFAAVRWAVNVFYAGRATMPPHDLVRDCGVFARDLFAPIQPVLERVAELLQLKRDSTTWIACIDEAEFLPKDYWLCINTFMRSEKRPLIVKVATLPYHHPTLETLVEDVSIQPNGNDFSYRTVDLDCDSPDFERLCDHVATTRLKKCMGPPERITLEAFLGVEGSDDLNDYYRKELPDEADDEALWRNAMAALSSTRRARYGKNAQFIGTGHSDFKKFVPVYFCRRMKQEDGRGNRTVGWFAGARVVRKVADGNPRRLLEILDALVEGARNSELTPKNQHRIIVDYCEHVFSDCEGLPVYGALVKATVQRLGERMAERVHGNPMRNGGCTFRIAEQVLEDDQTRKVLELATAYSIIVPDTAACRDTLSHGAEFRLSYAMAVRFWLPMRKGDDLVLKRQGGTLPLESTIRARKISRKEANAIAAELQFTEEEDE